MQKAAKESASLIVCGGRAFQSLEAELEKALKPNCFLVVFSTALGNRMMNEGVVQEHNYVEGTATSSFSLSALLFGLNDVFMVVSFFVSQCVRARACVCVNTFFSV